MTLLMIVLLLGLEFWRIKAECQCGIFLMDSDNAAIKEVYTGSTFPQVCERLEMDQLCRDFCYQTFVNVTNNGALEQPSPVFSISSGEKFCASLKQEVTNQEVAGYYRWCQTSWKFLGVKASEKLCCRETFIRCHEMEENLTTAAAPTTSRMDTGSSTETSFLTSSPVDISTIAPGILEGITAQMPAADDISAKNYSEENMDGKASASIFTASQEVLETTNLPLFEKDFEKH